MLCKAGQGPAHACVEAQEDLNMQTTTTTKVMQMQQKARQLPRAHPCMHGSTSGLLHAEDNNRSHLGGTLEQHIVPHCHLLVACSFGLCSAQPTISLPHSIAHLSIKTCARTYVIVGIPEHASACSCSANLEPFRSTYMHVPQQLHPTRFLAQNSIGALCTSV